MTFWLRALSRGAALFAASLLGWIAVILGYEIPCALGKHTQTDLPVVRAALRAEARVAMKQRTKSFALNQFLHELEEVRVFYSQI